MRMDVRGMVLDLDDTLIETTRLLIPAADLRAVTAMRAAGLPLGQDEALGAIRRLRQEGAARVLTELVIGAGCGQSVADAGEDAFFRYPDQVPELTLAPGAEEALDRLGDLAPLVLMSSGDKDTQREKVSRLGIAERFQLVVLVDHRAAGAKEDALAALLLHTGWAPVGTVVIGDRLDGEIRAGNRLGCRTVRVRMEAAECAAQEPAGDDQVPWRTVPSLLAAARLLCGEA